MLAIAGVALAALLVWRFVGAFEPAQRFLAPGRAELQLAGSGDYVIWHDYRTVYEGRSYDVAEALPGGARFRVRAPDGTSPQVEPLAGMRSDGSQGRSVSVARFSAPAAGLYEVAVEGAFEARPVSVGPHRLWPMLEMVGGVLAILAVAIGGAIAAALYGFLSGVPSAPLPAGAALPPEREKSLRQIATVIYGLQAAALLVGITFFVAVILGYVRRKDVAGTWLESHFTWQIRTFWWSLAWSTLGVATLVLVVGFFILLAAAVWYVYRIVRGWIELNEGRPIYRVEEASRRKESL